MSLTLKQRLIEAKQWQNLSAIFGNSPGYWQGLYDTANYQKTYTPAVPIAAPRAEKKSASKAQVFKSGVGHRVQSSAGNAAKAAGAKLARDRTNPTFDSDPEWIIATLNRMRVLGLTLYSFGPAAGINTMSIYRALSLEKRATARTIGLIDAFLDFREKQVAEGKAA